MNTRRLSPWLVMAFVYTLLVLWHGTWTAGLLVGDPFLTSALDECGLLFCAIPPLYLYALTRVAIAEQPFVERHRIVYVVAAGAALMPPLGFLALAFVG